MQNRSSRRDFLSKGLTAVTAFSIIPSRVMGRTGEVPPSDQLTVACIGVGSQGLRVMMDLLRNQQIRVVSVCDCNKGSDDYIEWGRNELRNKVRRLIDDPNWGGHTEGAICGMEPARQIVNAYYGKTQPSGTSRSCSAYLDFRELLENESDLDAVVIGTPDHIHAVASLAALRKGKHVFCQKPMSHSVDEARRMAALAESSGLATQVAIGNSASEATRVLCEWVWSGAIGGVTEVHNWSARPFWPQGMGRPDGAPAVPDYLNWDLWLGPAPLRPYHPDYQPFVWRGWRDFGTGAIGDMGCYSFDTLFRVLKLKAPESVEGSSSVDWAVSGTTTRRVVNVETFPRSSRMRFDFPAREDMPAVRIFWYDGGLRPDLPPEYDRPALPNEGMLMVGDRGKILCGFNGSSPRLLPRSRMDSFEPPPKSLPRSPGIYEEWLAGCRGEDPPSAHFGFAGPVTETILLGNVAASQGRRLNWDSEALRVTNSDEANKMLGRAYREGWSL